MKFRAWFYPPSLLSLTMVSISRAAAAAGPCSGHTSPPAARGWLHSWEQWLRVSTWETSWAGGPWQSPPWLRLSDVYMSAALCTQAHTCIQTTFFSLSLFCLLLQFACSHLCSIYVYQFISLAAALSMKCFYLVPSNSSWSYLPYESW